MRIQRRMYEVESLMKMPPHQITQHIRYGLTPLPFGTLLPSVVTLYMLETIYRNSLRSFLYIGWRISK